MRAYLPEGNACNRVRNISIGEITVALRVLAREPAISGAGVRVAEAESVNMGESLPSKYS